MKKLSDYFLGVGYKRLTDVEINPEKSNQHEINGVTSFKKLFGEHKREFKSRFIFLADEEELIWEEDGNCTWYDSRENHPTRSEFRLFYKQKGIFEKASVNDLLTILWKDKDELWLVITPQNSTSERQLIWLFDLVNTKNERKLAIKEITDDKEEEHSKKYVLEKLGIEIPVTNDEYLSEMLCNFDGKFPSTTVFSEYARKTLNSDPLFENPDESLLLSFEREEYLFKIMERHFVKEKLKEGFGTNGLDVDQFVSFSLSIHNRRKSRAGYSLENHLENIFKKHSIQYSRGAITERRNKPDFIFPSIDSYKNPSFDPSLLSMLASKTTAKDRWRQVLSEADRITCKHLITLEPSISITQTNEMRTQNVTLVVPSKIKSTYTENQQKEILSLTEFIHLIKENELKYGGKATRQS